MGLKRIEHINYRKSILVILYSAIASALVIALLWRIQCSISYYDETFNIYVSYMTAVLGQRHLIENGYIFSMGDLFNLPFVSLFYHITGGTEGIVLFIRFVYLGFNLVLAGVCVRVLKNYLNKKTLLLFGMVFATFFIGGMYTVSYDTVALFFSLLGGILLIGSELRENEKGRKYRYFAGLCHACMVYAYPFMAGVIALLFVVITIYRIIEVKREKDLAFKRIIKCLFSYWLPYFFGGMTIVVIFLCYVFAVGWQNIIFFQPGYIQKATYGRKMTELSSVAVNVVNTENIVSAEVNHVQQSAIFVFLHQMVKQMGELLNYMWIQQKKSLLVTIILLVQWEIGLIKKGNWRLLIIPEILVAAYVTHREITCFCGTTMYAYFFCWAPFLLGYLKKEEKKIGAILFIVLGSISIASFFAIGYTSVRTDKAHIGLYCGAICTFIIMIMLLKDKYFCGISLAIPLILCIASCNIGMAYIDHFQGADIQDCNYRIQSGVYKGMMTWEEDKKYEELHECLKGIDAPERSFILMSDYNYYAACMEGGLLATEGNINRIMLEKQIEENLGNNILKAEMIENWPIVFLIDEKDSYEFKVIEKEVLSQYYNATSAGYDYRLYVKR